MNIFIKTFLAFIPAIPLYFWGVYLVTSNPVHIFGFLAYFYFILTLLISPLSYFFSKISYFKRGSNKIIELRRQLWIFTGMFALLHMLKFYETVLGIYEKFFSESQSLSEFVLSALSGVQWNVFWMNTLSYWLGTLGIIFLIFLLITSNNNSQKILGARNWKRLQMCVYPLFIIIVAHIYFVGWWKGAYLYPAMLLIALRLLVWFDKNFRYTWRKRISHSGYLKFLCVPCWYIYDEELWDPDWGLAPGTKFEEIPDDWVCPVCGAAKKDFVPLDGHFKTNEEENHELVLRVHNKIFLTNDVIELQLLSNKEINVIPGQFCNLTVKTGDDLYLRSYSVASNKDNILTFLIKLKPGWIAWGYLRDVEKWEDIQILWPFGDFTIQQTTKRKIFIATGTWLSPIYNMMHASWDSEKILYFWVQTQDDLFYLKELQDIPNLTVHIYLSRQEESQYKYWRIEYSKIEYKKDDEIYICWNPWLVENLQNEFQKDNKSEVFYEKFL